MDIAQALENNGVCSRPLFIKQHKIIQYNLLTFHPRLIAALKWKAIYFQIPINFMGGGPNQCIAENAQ